MNYFNLIVLIAFFVSCSSNPTRLSDEARKVKIMEDRPYSGCEVVGNVKGISENVSYSLATNHARNQAVDLGGNYIKINEELKNGAKALVVATVYDCP